MKKKRRAPRAKPAKGLTESEREYYLRGQLDLAAEPGRILRFEWLCVMIGCSVMMLPLLIHSLLPRLVQSPFAERPHAAVLWGPVVALAILVVVSLYTSRRESSRPAEAWGGRSLLKPAPLFFSAGGLVMILTGTADLQRQFGLGRHVATLVDSLGKTSQTSPAVVEWMVLVLVTMMAATSFLALYVQIVVKPSWLYQQAVSDKTAQVNPQARTGPRVGPAEQIERIRVNILEAIDKADVTWFRVRFHAAVMYMAIATSAYLYLAFGRERYLRDPAAASFGMTAYTLNLILVVEGFRVRLINMKHMRLGTPDSQVLFDKCARILKWSLTNAAAALVYVWLLTHGGLDKGAEFLIEHIIPGWSRLQAWILSNVLAVFLLGVLSSMIANRMERLLKAKRRRKRVSG